jgi:hypothetical protein
MADDNNGAQPGDKTKVEVEGTVAGEKAASEPTPTSVAEVGKPSAAKKTPAGPSKGLDTKDETAGRWVGSGKSAKDAVKSPTADAPSADVLRSETEFDERDNARENIGNQADGNSNHNTVAGVNPVGVAQVDRPDYNPQRRPSSRANQMSTMGESPRDMAARVDAKKEGPTNAEITQERRDKSDDQREVALEDRISPYMGEQ